MKTAFKKKIKHLYHKAQCPLWSAIIQIIVFYTLVFHIIAPVTDHYSLARKDSNINNKINKALKKCGQDYFISWIVLDTKGESKRYSFKDVFGCANNSKCVFSVKKAHLNSFYDQDDLILDDMTFNYLNSYKTGYISYHDKKDIENLRKNYSTIDFILEKTNLPVYGLGLTVVKNLKKDIVYVFTMTNTSEKNKKCDRKDFSISLSEIARTGKNNL